MKHTRKITINVPNKTVKNTNKFKDLKYIRKEQAVKYG